MRKFFAGLLFWSGFAVGGRAAFRHFGTLLGWVVGRLSSAESAAALSTTIPPQIAQPVAKTYIVGDSAETAIAAAKRNKQRGLSSSISRLGEQISYSHEAIVERDALLALIEQVAEAEISSSVSVRLSQLSHPLNPELGGESLRVLVELAAQKRVELILETESAETIDATLFALEAVQSSAILGVGIQANLYRSSDDLDRVLALGCAIRLSTGSYAESAGQIFPTKQARDANFVHLMQRLLSAETTAALNTIYLEAHDDQLVQAILDFVKVNQIPQDRFTFEMVFGKRTDLQTHLANLGYQVQIYLPYGNNWYPYVMRRMVEKPQDLQLFLSGA